MRSEKVIREILEQYEFNLEADKAHRPNEVEDIERTKQWINCLRWVLEVDQ